MEITLDDEIKEVGREIGMRRGFYPKQVAQGRMTQADADRRIAVLESVYARLKGLLAPKTVGGA